MPNPQNIIPPKKGEVRNPHKGRGKGNRNRSTIAAYWLGMNVKNRNPITNIQEHVKMEDAAFLELVRIIRAGKAKDGDKINAIREVFDMMYGKLPQTIDMNLDKAEQIVKMFPTSEEIAEADK